MKKLFTLLTVAAFALMANAGVPVKITVDDASHVDRLEYAGKTYTFDNGNVLEFEATAYETAYLYLVEPWALDPQSTYTDKATWSDEPYHEDYYQDYKQTVQLYINPDSYEWYDFTIKTVSMVELRNQSCVVNVHGNPALINMYYQGTYYEPQLVEGKNEIKFMESESPIRIEGYDYTYAIYEVHLNGENVIEDDYSWDIEAKDGCVIDIYPVWPDKDVTVTLSFAGDATVEDVSAFEINYKEVDDYTKPITAKMGQYINIGFDTTYKNIASFKVNGEEHELNSWYPYYYGRLKEDVVLEVNMEKKPVWTGTVTVDDCSRIKYQVGGGKWHYPQENTFVVELPAEEYYSITFMPSDGYSQIESATFNGEEVTIYDGSFYVSYMKDGNEVNITTKAIVRDEAWAFYFDSPEKTLDEAKGLYGWWMDCAMYSRQDELDNMQAGYNVIPMCADDLPFHIGINASLGETHDAYVFAYLNNEPCPLDYLKNESFWTIEAKDKDVFKLYLADEPGQAPAFSSVNFSIEDGSAVVSTTVDKLQQVEVANNMTIENQLPGTLFEMVLADDYALSVNDVSVEADEDGVFRFSVNGNTNVNVSLASGIDEVTAAETEGETPVYNIIGAKVSNGDVKHLPAGIYVKKGCKVYVK